MWNLFFTAIPIVQYAVLNASMITYDYYKSLITEIIWEMKAIASKTDKPEEPMKILEEARHKISKKVRNTITGGDIIQIEDYKVDMNELTPA